MTGSEGEGGGIGPEGPSISVVIATFRRFEPPLQTVADLLRQDYPHFEVVVADQNPSWPPELIGRLHAIQSDPRVRWLPIDAPGVVSARNRAAAVSTGDVLLFVDDDVSIPDRMFIRRHAQAHRDPTIAAVCGRELTAGQIDPRTETPLVAAQTESTTPAGATTLSRLLRFDRSQPCRAEVAVFSTCNGSITRRAFDRVGGFDEAFRGASYGDDADLVLRLAALGERIVYEPNAWLVHLMDRRGGLRLSDASNPFSAYDRCVSGLIFTFRHAGPGEFWPLLYGWVLRRSIFLRLNMVQPWRQPAVIWGLLRAGIDAWRTVRRDSPGLRASGTGPSVKLPG